MLSLIGTSSRYLAPATRRKFFQSPDRFYTPTRTIGRFRSFRRARRSSRRDMESDSVSGDRSRTGRIRGLGMKAATRMQTHEKCACSILLIADPIQSIW